MWIFQLLVKTVISPVEMVHWTIKSMCMSYVSKSKEFLKLKMSALFTETQIHYIGNILIK